MIKNWIDHKIRRIHIEIQETAMVRPWPITMTWPM